MTLIFNRLLEVVKIHVHASADSRGIMHTKTHKNTRDLDL